MIIFFRDLINNVGGTFRVYELRNKVIIILIVQLFQNLVDNKEKLSRNGLILALNILHVMG